LIEGIATMTGLLLTTLFVLAALLAAGTLAQGLRGIVAEATQTRTMLAACPKTRSFEYRISEVKVLRGAAQVLVLPVRQSGWRLPQPELRAAA
jgi:hypothetical protein